MTRLGKIPLAAAVVIGGLGLMAPSAVAAPSGPPRLHLQFKSVMVDTNDEVYGAHFRPDEKVLVYECSETKWVRSVGTSPCTGYDEVGSVDSHGRFAVKVDVIACSTPTGVPQTCYLGILKDGPVKSSLQPYATVTVTFP